jgi:hypothetical protein
MSTRLHIQRPEAGGALQRGGSIDAAHPTEVLAERLRRAVGFRVDGPEGRIGRVRALVPGDLGVVPQVRVDVGLFVRKEIRIPLDDVREVDRERRRVLVDSVPRIPRRGRAELARRVRRFVRTSGAR